LHIFFLIPFSFTGIVELLFTSDNSLGVKDGAVNGAIQVGGCGCAKVDWSKIFF
jgi:hypothetical protein